MPASLITSPKRSLRYLKRKDVEERFFNTGVETLDTTPEEFAAAIKADLVRWTKVIRDAGIGAKK